MVGGSIDRWSLGKRLLDSGVEVASGSSIVALDNLMAQYMTGFECCRKDICIRKKERNGNIGGVNPV